MNGRMMRGMALAAMMAACAMPAGAEVKEADASGFTVSHAVMLRASPAQVWAMLVAPARWWSAEHSWSGSAANFSLDPVAGGCFCERWAGGSVEHGRVLQALPGRLLRVSGALGPLQSEALTGTLSITLAPEGEGTRLSVDYVVGGHARFPLRTVARAVDGVLGEQVQRLAAQIGPEAPSR